MRNHSCKSIETETYFGLKSAFQRNRLCQFQYVTFSISILCLLLSHRIFYYIMQIKELIPSASTRIRQQNKQSKPSTPYDQIPIALKGHHAKPFSEILQNSDYCLARKQKVTEITRYTLQRDFKIRHQQEEAREQQLLKGFKVRCRPKEHSKRPQTNEEFFLGLLKDRQEEKNRLNFEYLAMVRSELKDRKDEAQEQGGFSGGEKLVCEYNIVFDYRSEHLPNPFRPMRQ